MVQQLIQNQQQQSMNPENDPPVASTSDSSNNRHPMRFGSGNQLLFSQVVQGAPANNLPGLSTPEVTDTSGDNSDLGTDTNSTGGPADDQVADEPVADDPSDTISSEFDIPNPPAPAFKPDICAITMEDAKAMCAVKPNCERAVDGEDCYQGCSMLNPNKCGPGSTCHPFVSGCTGLAVVTPEDEGSLFATPKSTFLENEDGSA
jgi:hypothetical protein